MFFKTNHNKIIIIIKILLLIMINSDTNDDVLCYILVLNPITIITSLHLAEVSLFHRKSKSKDNPAR